MMFRVEVLEEDVVVFVELPEGMRQDKLIGQAKTEIRELIATQIFYGRDVRFNGRITTGMAMMLGHEMGHVCKSLSVFDPKENMNFEVVRH